MLWMSVSAKRFCVVQQPCSTSLWDTIATAFRYNDMIRWDESKIIITVRCSNQSHRAASQQTLNNTQVVSRHRNKQVTTIALSFLCTEACTVAKCLNESSWFLVWGLLQRDSYIVLDESLHPPTERKPGIFSAGWCLCHCCLFTVSNSCLLFSHGRPSLSCWALVI